MTPLEIFQSRITNFKAEEINLKTAADRWTLIRGTIFLIVAVVTYYFAISFGNFYGIAAFLICFSVFLYSVSKHQDILLLVNKAALMAKINENEIKRLEYDLQEFENGDIFSDVKHFYADDLDLFGKSSMFQLLNRTHTHEGKSLLANWLKFSASKNEILARQEASNELSKSIEFRQKLEMEAMLSDKVGQPTDKLLTWIKGAANQKIQKPLFKYAQYLPFITIGILIGAILGLYTYYFVALSLLVQAIVLKQVVEDVSAALEETEIAGETLKSYSYLLQIIDIQGFKNESLLFLKNKISSSPEAVAGLNKIIHNLSYRSNPAFALTGGILMMWDLRYFNKLESWKAKHKNDLGSWLNVVSEIEALNSLAGFEYANPNCCRPIISNEQIILKAINLGHPMIKHSKRVANNITLSGLGKTHIITGSNMSGKSTFERTVGVNLVLALMGGVVCAESFECSAVQLFTSMRTQDSLEKATSSFYAELKRLEQLINLTKLESKTLPVMYFLDEILKGTNSKDRHIGAKALILQLNKANTSGFISTHDVELGDEFEGTEFIKNYSFSSEVNQKGLVFDYKLREGVCHSFNASELMRQIGIKI